MIIYKSTKAQFVSDVMNGIIADKVYSIYQLKIGSTSKAEIRAWQNSLLVMGNLLDTEEIADNATVCIEYRLPNLNRRIDFIIAGKNKAGVDHVVIIELKQWSPSSVREVSQQDLVEVQIGGGKQLLPHPSYQAWSYAATLQEYNETVQNENISLFPCAFLHNYAGYRNDPILNPERYPEIDQAPVFTQPSSDKLLDFIAEHVAAPDNSDVMARIENSPLKPSKSLQDVIGNILRNKSEFIMIDSQKKIYETLLYHFRQLEKSDDRKKVFIIQGGPGTGKTVLALNLLAEIINEGGSAAYVTKNSAPRNVYRTKLADDKYKGVMIDMLLRGSGSFVGRPRDEYDVLITDEAHRLNEKSGLFNNLGENQILEIINAARISVFFIDERQIVTSKDIGTVDEIRRQAKAQHARIYTSELISQFRCNGSDGYLSFLDDLLEISKEEYSFNPGEYMAEVVDDPNAMFQTIRRRNMVNNKARVIAGYCWDWKSKNNLEAMDIELPEYSFQAQWNFNSTSTWAIDKDSVSEIGCIHTSQGLEFEYAGVIIGDDLRFEDGHVVTDFSRRARTDKSLQGLTQLCRKGDKEALKKADTIIRNTYRTLLSRAMKGTYIFCTDKALSDYIRRRLEKAAALYSRSYSNEELAAEKGSCS